MRKVFVQKRGNVHTVHVNMSSGEPIPVSTPDQAPPGGFPQQFDSIDHVKQVFKTNDVVVLEKPAPPVRILRKDGTITQEAEKILAEGPAAKPNAAPAQRQPTPQVSTGGRDVSELQRKAEEFLKRIKYALDYASEENSVRLKIQVDVVEELIEEVFKDKV